MTPGASVRVKPLRRSRWMRGKVDAVHEDCVRVCVEEYAGMGRMAHRYYTVPPERVKEEGRAVER